MIARILCLTTLLVVLGAGPARAVVGGVPVDPAGVPWLADVSGCGGTLVAPDRVLTAGHCVAGRELEGLGGAVVGTEQRTPVAFAMHPGWRRANGDNVLDDVAVVQLDRPVDGVAPVVLGGAPGAEATILGRGRALAPGTTRNEALALDTTLRGATLRPISDADCARAFRTARGNGGERFDPARMVCAIDVDGRAPLSSGCNGDSGGPLFAGPVDAPVLLGVVSWGGRRCGADHLPSVFADPVRYRAFITDPSPVWAPTTREPARVTGARRPGGTLTCGASGFAFRPTALAYSWQRQGGRRPAIVSRRRSYRVTRADAGHDLVCSVMASNAGGPSSVPFDATLSRARIPRAR